MISAAQAARLRATATRSIEQGFATTITLGTTDVPAARWTFTQGAQNELGDILPTADIAFRIRLAVIPEGFAFVENKTKIIENGKTFLVVKIRRGNGDPALVAECKEP